MIMGPRYRRGRHFCVHAHTHTHTYAHTNTHIHTHTHAHTHRHTQTHARARTKTHTRMGCVCVCVCVGGGGADEQNWSQRLIAACRRAGPCYSLATRGPVMWTGGWTGSYLLAIYTNICPPLMWLVSKVSAR